MQKKSSKKHTSKATRKRIDLPQDIEERFMRITDNPDEYPASARELLSVAYETGNRDAVVSTIKACEKARERERAEVGLRGQRKGNQQYLDRVARCEALAAAAVQGFDEAQELALVSLLNEIANADGADVANLALSSLYAAFRASSGLFDRAIELLVADNDKRKTRRK